MLKKYPIVLAVTWIIGLLVFPLPLVLLMNHVMIAPPNMLVLYDFGVVAYSWWLFEIFLSTRPQWLDRLIGLPKMYLIHSLLGIGTLVLAFVHRHFLTSMGQAVRLTGNLAWYLLIFGIIYAMFFLSGMLTDRLPWLARLKHTLERVFKHQLTLWIHRLNLVVVILIWIHVHVIGRLNSQPLFMVPFDVYSLVILGDYLYYHLIAARHVVAGKIVANQPLSPRTQVIDILLGQPLRRLNAGDYFFIKFPQTSQLRSEPHPFSLASPAKDNRRLRFVVKITGDDTEQFSQLPAKTDVTLEGPFGRFDHLVRTSLNRPLVLIGLGSGAAPLLSIAESYQGIRQIHVLRTVRSQSEAILDDDFQALVKNDVGYYLQIGRFTSNQLRDQLRQQELSDAQFIVVGAGSAVLNIRHMLRAIGVESKRIQDERMTL